LIFSESTQVGHLTIANHCRITQGFLTMRELAAPKKSLPRTNTLAYFAQPSVTNKNNIDTMGSIHKTSKDNLY